MLSADKWEHSLCGQWKTCSPSCSQKHWVASLPAAPNGFRAKATAAGWYSSMQGMEGRAHRRGGAQCHPQAPSRCDHARPLGNHTGVSGMAPRKQLSLPIHHSTVVKAWTTQIAKLQRPPFPKLPRARA